jgi:hypothetical protein
MSALRTATSAVEEILSVLMAMPWGTRRRNYMINKVKALSNLDDLPDLG